MKKTNMNLLKCRHKLVLCTRVIKVQSLKANALLANIQDK